MQPQPGCELRDSHTWLCRTCRQPEMWTRIPRIVDKGVCRQSIMHLARRYNTTEYVVASNGNSVHIMEMS